MSIKNVCSIAATEHAGLLTDLRIYADLGLHGTSLLTSVTTDNSSEALNIEPCSNDSLQSQWQALIEDVDLQIVKVGMLFNIGQLRTIRTCLAESCLPVIWDPNGLSSVGKRLHQRDKSAIRLAMIALLDVCTVFTPSIPEAEWLLERQIRSNEEIVQAACKLVALGARHVLIKGEHIGDSLERCEDYFCNEEQSFWISQPHTAVNNSHASGCILSTAIAGFMAHDKKAVDAVVLASSYVNLSMAEGFKVGKGNSLLANIGWPTQFEHYPAVSDTPNCKERKAFIACSPHHGGLYPVVDSVEWVEKLLLNTGVETLQIRLKNKTHAELESAIVRAVALAKHYQAQLYINDHWELAIKHRAYGVHLGQEDLVTADLECIRRAGLRLGISSHSEYEWLRAAAFKPSYIALGSVFPTNTKPVEIIGLDNLQRWVNTLKPQFALTAIGGIDLDNLHAVLATGVESVAVVSAVTRAESYEDVCQAFQSKF